ncbi:MAG: hypothetical protein ACT4NY_32065, partial [Pseudonocardiales bacterium]
TAWGRRIAMSAGSDGRIGEALNPPASAGSPEVTSLEGGSLLGSSTLLPVSRDTGSILAQTLGASSGQSFMIDIERAPQSIADLEAAAEFLKRQAKVAQGLANVSPPGVDGVSLNAAKEIGKWASDSGVNNLEATLIAGAEQLRTLAMKLREELQAYLQVDELPFQKPSDGLPNWPSDGLSD